MVEYVFALFKEEEVGGAILILVWKDSTKRQTVGGEKTCRPRWQKKKVKGSVKRCGKGKFARTCGIFQRKTQGKNILYSEKRTRCKNPNLKPRERGGGGSDKQIISLKKKTRTEEKFGYQRKARTIRGGICLGGKGVLGSETVKRRRGWREEERLPA